MNRPISAMRARVDRSGPNAVAVSPYLGATRSASSGATKSRPTGLDPEKRAEEEELLTGYLDMLALVERLHRLLLDTIKDEFERLERVDLNAVQALLLFNISDKVMTAGELKSRGHYQGSNVSYNLKKLVEGGFIHHERSQADRRTVRVRLTKKGHEVHDIVARLFREHAAALGDQLLAEGLNTMNGHMRSVERFWAERIRYVY